jgi:DNA processing protein
VDLFSSPPPLAPPTSEEGMLSWLRLLRSRRVGPTTFYKLMNEHGSPAGCLDALPHIAATAGVRDYATCPPGIAEAELAKGRAIGAQPVFYGAPNYPMPLYDLPDAPPFLWAMGRLELLHTPALAMVGARNASSLGGRMARKLATDLGHAGFTIVSGLARGIDRVAHDAALPTGTIAVVASGVNVIYPKENAELTEHIRDTGLILSEAPPDMQPQSRHFPKRNRIISGLSRAVIVVEAAPKSGSLITARNALDQGRDVMAVPGHPFDARAAGCNMLIRDGATLVRGADDVIEALGPLALPQRAHVPAPDIPAAPTDTSGLPGRILTLLDSAPIAEDQLIRDLDLPTSVIIETLLSLELEGAISRHPGGLVTRALPAETN